VPRVYYSGPSAHLCVPTLPVLNRTGIFGFSPVWGALDKNVRRSLEIVVSSSPVRLPSMPQGLIFGCRIWGLGFGVWDLGFSALIGLGVSPVWTLSEQPILVKSHLDLLQKQPPY
jgi:hypothetical protein